MVGVGEGFLVADEGGGSRAVVAVGDIEVVDGGEGVGDGGDGGVVVDDPEGVAEAVFSDEVILELFGCLAGEDVGEDGIVVTTLDEAVAEANKVAESGDIVLLSPTTSSFDQYSCFEERGDHFKRIVNAL